jgi:hypothetical protein
MSVAPAYSLKGEQQMPAKYSVRFCFLALLLTLFTVVCMKGCDKDKSSLPTTSQEGGLAMKIFANPETQAKLTGLTIDIVGLNEAGQPDAPRIPTITVSDLNLPVTIPLTLYDPPCRYQVTARAQLSREAPRVATRVLDICQESRLTLTIDAFEGFWIGGNPLQAPDAVNAGEAVYVACGTDQLDAPDKERYPLTATLSEQDGRAVSGPFDVNVAVAGSFPDPYPLSSPTDQRHFTCVISDGHSTPQTFTVSVRRIPVTSPTVPPTPTPTPTPDSSSPDPSPPAPQPGATNLTVTLNASPAPVPDGTNATTVTVTLRDSAGALYGESVAVALNATNGNLSQTTLEITGGTGTVTLSDDGLLARPENVTVSAEVTSSGYSGNGDTTVLFEGAAPVTNLTVNLTASPDTVPFGTNSTTIEIELLDNGTPVSDSITVTLSASSGTLSQSTLTIIGGSGTVTLSDNGLLTLPEDVTVSAQVVTTSGYSGSGDTTVSFEEVPPSKTLYRSYSCGTPDGSGGCASDPGANVWTDYNDSFSTSEPPVHPKPDCTLGETLNAPISGKTIPLYSYYRWAPYPGGPDGDVKNDSMTTTQRNELEPAGWVNEKPLGYVFKEPIPGRTTPLYRRYRNYLYRPENPMDSTDYMTTLDPSENGILGSGWETDRGVGNPLGHILKPTSDSCPQP